MAISDNYVPVKQLGDGVTVNFGGLWNVILASFLRVYWEDTVTGVQTLKVLGTHYSLVFTPSGFTVTFLPGFTPPNTVYVVIGRSVSLDQSVPYKTSQGFQGAVEENSFDKLTAITQDLQDQIDRSPKLPLGSTSSLVFEGAPQDGYGFVWDGTGGNIRNTTASLAVLEGNASVVAANITNINAVGGNIANVNSVAGNATNINAVATNATNINLVAGSIANVNAVGGSIANVNTVAVNIASVNTVATNIANVNNALNNANIAKAAAGFTYTYSSTTTAADPGAGFLRFDNASLPSATSLYISETTGLAQAIGAELATWDDSTSVIHGKLRLFSQTNPAIFALFNLTGTLTDNGTWDTFTVAYVNGSGTINNNDVLTAQYVRTGDKGDQGNTGAAGTLPTAAAAGTAQAITADFTPDITLTDKQLCVVIASTANTATAPTFAPDGLTARTITKFGGQALVAGDIYGAGHALILEYNLANTRWELLNPAYAQNVSSGGGIPIAIAAGTAQAITADYSPDITLTDKQLCAFISAGVNTAANPTFAPDGLTARTIKRSGNQNLNAGDIGAAGSVHILEYNLAGTRWELLNPVYPLGLTGNQIYYYAGDGTFQPQKFYQYVQTVYTTNASLAGLIPYDDTIPLSTEGTQIISQSFSTNGSGSRLEIDVSGNISVVTTIQPIVIAVFAGTTCIHAEAVYPGAVNQSVPFSLNFAYSPGSGGMTGITYSVRVGSAANNVACNGTTAARFLGGIQAVTMSFREYL